jgi:muramidase (phage lysozyme)
MGLTVEDINQGIASYTRLQATSNSTQRKTTAEIVQGSAEYIKQLDILSKLTGKSAESLQAEREARNRESAFIATQRQIQRKANIARDAGEYETAKRYEDTIQAMNALIDQIPKEAQGGVKQALTGLIGGSKEGMALYRAAPGVAQELAGVKERGLTMQEVGPILDRLKKQGEATIDAYGQLYQFNNLGEEFFGAAVGFTEIGKERAKAAEEADREQKRQKTTPNDMVKAQVSMRQAQESATRNTEAFVNLGVKPATSALETFSDVLDTVSDKLLPGTSAARGKSAPAPRTGGTGNTGSLLDIIGQGESGGNYNALVGGREANLTSMTIAEVQKLQSTMIKSGHASTAVGKYQMIAATLAEQAKKAGLDPNRTKFDQSTQDLLASQLVGQAGYGRKDSATVMKNLAGTWASLPQDMSGRGRYDGYNTNRANINPNDLLSAIQSGPKDRYSPALASISSNIPKTVVPGFDSTAATTERRSSDDMLRLTIAKQDEMIALLKANNSQNQKMIQRVRG